MLLESKVFRHNELMPKRYTGEGENVSPPLEWCNVPPECKSFALVCEDVDTKIQPHWDSTFVHWVVYNIPADIKGLPEGMAQIAAQRGTNSFGQLGYCGPLPPPDDEGHHYHFTLYALDAVLDIPEGVMVNEFMNWIEGHILDTVTLTGRYKRTEPLVSYTEISGDCPSPELGL